MEKLDEAGQTGMPGIALSSNGLGLEPKRADVEALMKRCQIGVCGRSALDNAHSIMAECYGALGALMLEIERLHGVCVGVHDGLLRGYDDRELLAMAENGWRPNVADNPAAADGSVSAANLGGD